MPTPKLADYPRPNIASRTVDLSVVIPAYNEAARIGLTLDKILAYLKQQPFDSEIVVVDDGSTDDTVQVCRKKLASASHEILLNEANRGKGHSVRKGILAASGQIILFTDADLSTPIEDYEKLLASIHMGSDIAIGSRSTTSSDVQQRQNVIREIMGKTFNRIAHLLTFKGIHDSQCGFKAFKAAAAKKLFERQKVSGFCFDAEILYLAQRMRLKTSEVGVRWVNSPQSKVRIIKDSLTMLIDLFRIRLLHMGEKF
jgi:dolichyl-phosphate beta-glucosyltransferase